MICYFLNGFIVSLPRPKVDGFVKTIFPSFLDALARDEWLSEG